MRIKRRIITLLAAQLVFLFSTFAADGYIINVRFKDASQGKLYLMLYRGSESFAFKIDSAAVTTPNQLVSFKRTSKIVGGVYRLEFEHDKKNKINLIADNGSVINCEVNGNNMTTLSCKAEPNNSFLKLQSGLLNDTEQKSLLNKLIQTYPTSAIALYAKIDLKILESNALVKEGQADKAFKAHLKNIDFKDKRIQLLPNIYQYLFTYTKLSPIDNDHYKANVDSLFKNMKCKDRNYIFYLDWVFKNLGYYQKENLNQTYKYTYEKYLDKDTVCANVDMKFYGKITGDLAKLSDLKIGVTMPDFKMQDSLKNVSNLADLVKRSKYTFLVFYDQDCDHCKETLPKIAEFLSKKGYPQDLFQIIGFRNTLSTLGWQKFIVDSKMQNWLNMMPADQEYLNLLKVYSNPKFFLLDGSSVIRLMQFDENVIASIVGH